MNRYRLFTQDDGDGFPYTDEEITKDGEYVKYDEAQELLKEAYESIVKSCIHFDREYQENYCIHCGELHVKFENINDKDVVQNVKHKSFCIVLKAEEYLKNV